MHIWFILDEFLIERWQYEILEHLKPFYGEHNVMGKLPTVGGKSAVNALEIHVVKTNHNIEGITQEQLNNYCTQKPSSIEPC